MANERRNMRRQNGEIKGKFVPLFTLTTAFAMILAACGINGGTENKSNVTPIAPPSPPREVVQIGLQRLWKHYQHLLKLHHQ